MTGSTGFGAFHIIPHACSQYVLSPSFHSRPSTSQILPIIEIKSWDLDPPSGILISLTSDSQSVTYGRSILFLVFGITYLYMALAPRTNAFLFLNILNITIYRLIYLFIFELLPISSLEHFINRMNLNNLN